MPLAKTCGVASRRRGRTQETALVAFPSAWLCYLRFQGKGTALHHATHSGYPEVVSLLLEKGANPKAQDNRGDKPGDKFDPEVRALCVLEKRLMVLLLVLLVPLLLYAFFFLVLKAGYKLMFVLRAASFLARMIGKPISRKRGLNEKDNFPAPLSESRRQDLIVTPCVMFGARRLHKRPQVSEGNRRAIAKALAKATRGSSASRRTSSSRSKRHPTDGSREGPPPASSSLSRSKLRPAPGDSNHGTAAANGNNNHHHNGEVGMHGRSLPLNEDEELSAAAAAVAAAAWTPKSPSRRPRPIAIPETQAAAAAAVARVDGIKVDTAGRESKHCYPSPSSIRRAAEPEEENGGGGQPLSPSSPRGDGARERGPAAASPRLSVPEIDDLRRRVKDASLAAERAAERDDEGRAAVRRALAEADERAQAVGAAERSRSEMLGALVQVWTCVCGRVCVCFCVSSVVVLQAVRSWCCCSRDGAFSFSSVFLFLFNVFSASLRVGCMPPCVCDGLDLIWSGAPVVRDR